MRAFDFREYSNYNEIRSQYIIRATEGRNYIYGKNCKVESTEITVLGSKKEYKSAEELATFFKSLAEVISVQYKEINILKF